MSKLLAVLLSILLPVAASAACTYSTDASSSIRTTTCTATTEAAPTLATEGVSIFNRAGLTVAIESSGAMTAGGTFQAYWYNPASGAWVRLPDWDLTAQALTKQAWVGFRIPVPVGRLDFRPTGTGANTVSIYLVTAGP